MNMHRYTCWLALGLQCLGCSSSSDSGEADGGITQADAAAAVDSGTGQNPGKAPSADAGADSGANVADAAGGADAGPPPCTALFCEDFEKGTLDTSRWTLNAGYDAANTVTIQSTKSAHGGFAAHAHLTNSGGGFAYLKTKTPFPTLASELWGRAYFFHTIDATVAHNALIKAESNGAQTLEVGQSQGKVQLTFYPPSGEAPAGYQTAIPAGKWVCLEWHMSKTLPQIELYADGTSIAQLKYMGASSVPSLSDIELGFETHSANSATDDVYFDDVALDAKRVGCLP
jgi:hypothetical protein